MPSTLRLLGQSHLHPQELVRNADSQPPPNPTALICIQTIAPADPEGEKTPRATMGNHLLQKYEALSLDTAPNPCKSVIPASHPVRWELETS